MRKTNRYLREDRTVPSHSLPEAAVNGSPIEGKMAYRLVGKHIVVQTTIWIYPHQLVEKVAKYKLKGQWLVGPGLSPDGMLLSGSSTR